MFENLTKKSLKFSLEGGQVGFIPSQSEIRAMDFLWKMMSWICNDFCDEFDKTGTNIGCGSDAHIHFASRTISYVNHAFLLENLFRVVYENFCKSINRRENNKETRKRKSELENILVFRKKIAGHLSFSNFEFQKYKGFSERDNMTTRLSSLNVITKLMTSDKVPYGFFMGGGWITFGGEQPSTDIPNINIFAQHKILKFHFEKWCDMFFEKIKEIEKLLPIERVSINGIKSTLYV